MVTLAVNNPLPMGSTLHNRTRGQHLPFAVIRPRLGFGGFSRHEVAVQVAKQRSLPTPRPEGMNNVVSATLRLLETKRPAEITLRDIAQESGHGNRLIVEWFGGKGGLFAAVVAKVFEDLASSGTLFYSDIALRPEFRSAVRIFNYMQVLHPEFVEQARTPFMFDVIRARLRDFRGFTDEQADIAVRRIMVHTVGLAIMAEFHHLPDDVVIEMTKAEVRAAMGFDLPDNPNRP